MNEFSIAETIHRLVKQVVDSGIASSLTEAESMFKGFRIGFVVSADEEADPHHQAALLTGIAIARRVFLGGVWVQGSLNVPISTPLYGGKNLRDAVIELGGQPDVSPPNIPLINIGRESITMQSNFHVRLTYSGWCGGSVPADCPSIVEPKFVMPLAPMLAVALAINDAFSFVSSQRTVFGRRAIGLSLWKPNLMIDWSSPPADEPELQFLPARLWLIGLGHLGQAYLWALGLLPYSTKSELSLVLQDFDIITPSSESTSLLSSTAQVGRKKTREMASWAERHGFNCTINERLFAKNFHRIQEEPSIALCGLDNVLGRTALDQVGFDFVVEAGLGRGHRDFRNIRLHTLPDARAASEIWKLYESTEDISSKPGYQKMLQNAELDRCGITLLAGKAVGAPFVGAVAATLVISEVLRLLHAGQVNQLIDLELMSLENRTVIERPCGLKIPNPGFVMTSGEAERQRFYDAQKDR